MKFTYKFPIAAILLFLFAQLAWANNGSFGASLFGNNQSFLPVEEAFKSYVLTEDDKLLIRFEIADGYYLYKKRFSVEPTNSEDLKLSPPEFTTNGLEKDDPNFGRVTVYYDRMDIETVFTAEKSGDYSVRLKYQGCADKGLCYPPKTDILDFTYHKTAYSTPATSNTSGTYIETPNKTDNYESASGVFSFIQTASLATIVGVFFLLGLGLTFTPCVFPMVPIISSIIGGNKHINSRQALLLAWSYVLGMATTYAAAGVLTGLLGASANIQAYLQSAPLLITFAAIFAVLALSMFGLFELQLPSAIQNRLNAKSQQLHGGHIISVAGIGALSALVVSPCVSAPLAGALLYISSTGDAIVGGLSLFALGIGMGVPLILVAVGGNKYLPKAGHWMNVVKAVYGVLLLAVAIWLLERILPAPITLLLWSLLIGLTASQMGAFEKAAYGFERFKKGIAFFLALYATALFIGALTGASNPLNPLERLVAHAADRPISNNAAKSFTKVTTTAQFEKQLMQAKALKQAVFVDFYADWCISCKVMENTLFPHPEVQKRFSQLRLVTIDVTDNTEESQKLLDRFGLFGPPGLIFYNQEGLELSHMRQMGEISVEQLTALLDQAIGISHPYKTASR